MTQMSADRVFFICVNLRHLRIGYPLTRYSSQIFTERL
ncbi:MAG: hypothetical protein QOE68_744 [Thermoanaerobaculia bacterium]|nr:hypothetical protein [Thermoanaerobaculia bacterium]